MLTLPIPLVAALILGFWAVRHLLTHNRATLFVCLLGVCTAQALVISLVQYYGVVWMSPFQPVTATFVPVLTWLTFQAAAKRPLEIRRDAAHGFAPILATFCVFFAPIALDVLIPLLFAGYGVAILIVIAREDDLSRARLDAGPVSARVWTTMAILLLLSALSDVLIAAAFALGQGQMRSLIASVFASFTLVGIGFLSLSPNAESIPDQGGDKTAPEPSPEQTDLVARLDAYMAEARPYLDPDLTLSRLARRLHVPIKQLSAAVNRAKGENVSRYVNAWRVREARQKLAEGANVTEAMLASGFNTKSNFNREFLRVTGQTPSAYAATLKQ